MVTSPTDPLEVLEQQAVARIRRHVAQLQLGNAAWVPRPCPPRQEWHPMPRPQGVGY